MSTLARALAAATIDIETFKDLLPDANDQERATLANKVVDPDDFAWKFFFNSVFEYSREHAVGMRPFLEPIADLEVSQDHSSRKSLVFVGLIALACAADEPLPERYHEAFRVLLTAKSDKAFKAVLRRFPPEERETYAIQGRIEWFYAGACCTDAAAHKMCDAINGSWFSREYDLEDAIAAFEEVGEIATPALVEALADRKNKLRDVLLTALARTGGTQAAPALISYLDDGAKVAWAQAVQGLIHLGPGVAPLLETTLLKGKKRARQGAVAVLEGLPEDPEVGRLAGLALAKEKVSALRDRLGALAGGSEEQESSPFSALETLRGATSDERRSALREQILAYYYRSTGITWEPSDEALVAELDWIVDDHYGGWEDRGHPSHVTELLSRYREHPLAPWAWAQILAGVPAKFKTKFRASRRNSDACAGLAATFDTCFGKNGLPAARHFLSDDPGVCRAGFYRTLANHGTSEDVDRLLQGLGESSADVPEVCLEGLLKQEGAAAKAYPLLTARKTALRTGAARLLEAQPSADHLPRLELALGKEKSNAVIDCLRAALEACSPNDEPLEEVIDKLDAAALDARISARVVKKLPKFIKASELPAVRWDVDEEPGPALSADALRWFINRLAEKSENWHPALGRVRRRLVDKDCHALLVCLRAMLEDGGPKNARDWVLHAHALLASADQLVEFLNLGEVGRSSIYSDAYGKFIRDRVKIMELNGSDTAVFYLDSWTNPGFSSALQKHARRTLRTVAERTGRSTFELAEAALFGSKDAEIERVVAHLEQAMILNRRWSASQWRLLFEHPVTSPLSSRLLFAAKKEGITTLFSVAEDGRCLDVNGSGVEPQGTICIPHPVVICEPDLDDWRREFSGTVQPFPQLERRIASFDLSGDDPFSTAVHLYKALPPRTFRNKAESLGFERGPVVDNGFVERDTKRVGNIEVDLSHSGWHITYDADDPVELHSVDFIRDGARLRPMTWNEVPPGLVSDTLVAVQTI